MSSMASAPSGGGETRFKNWTAYVFYRLLARLVDIEIPTDTGDFRLMSRRALDALNAMPEHNRFIRGMVSWIGFKQVAVEYERDPRFAGETKYSLMKMLKFAIDAISGFSVVPLRISTLLGFFCAFVGVFFMIWTAASYFLGVAIQGWTTLMSVVLILGSAQLLVLGVIGEYLGRLYMESKRRPLFIIEEVVGAPAPVAERPAASGGARHAHAPVAAFDEGPPRVATGPREVRPK